MDKSIEVAAQGAIEMYQYGAMGVIIVTLIAFVLLMGGLLVWVIRENKKEIKELTDKASEEMKNSRLDTLEILKAAYETQKQYSKNESDQSNLMREIVKNQEKALDQCMRRNS